MERQLEVKGSGDDQSSSCCYELREEDQHESSVKWMSSKMRILRKFMCSDQNTVRKIRRRRRRRRRRRHQQIQDDQKKKGNRDQSNYGSSDTGGISRVCSDCSTTKTPLWRSGPLGPKSLCNACGIKRRKARKAVSAATVSGKLQPVVTIKPRRNQALKVDCSVPFKKRCRFIATAEQTAQRKKLSFEDIAISLNKSLSALNRVFPQDEKDAAVLLMALSCGIVCSL